MTIDNGQVEGKSDQRYIFTEQTRVVRLECTEIIFDDPIPLFDIPVNLGGVWTVLSGTDVLMSWSTSSFDSHGRQSGGTPGHHGRKRSWAFLSAK